MACVLATPGSVPLLAETHAGSLLTCWLGFCQVGLEPFPVLTHWATTTNFMGLLPLPRFRAYLGATSAWLGDDCYLESTPDLRPFFFLHLLKIDPGYIDDCLPKSIMIIGPGYALNYP